MDNDDIDDVTAANDDDEHGDTVKLGSTVGVGNEEQDTNAHGDKFYVLCAIVAMSFFVIAFACADSKLISFMFDAYYAAKRACKC